MSDLDIEKLTDFAILVSSGPPPTVRDMHKKAFKKSKENQGSRQTR